ncbi:MAG: hypothetical protein Q4D63_05760 [Neisseria animaloris]|nr:hypothetical protein [Neisseria animaloris]
MLVGIFAAMSGIDGVQNAATPTCGNLPQMRFAKAFGRFPQRKIEALKAETSLA